ncbi:hypothetical protein BJ322DRAFT_231757 [Thelephora terrestris]|uniref:DUF6535 domain-containing protein n=1 Tax=Thelephora terrestris TaxID=56493 RepID=A0A9P6L470_9AGAM|nr:hypothetical protein BJ322DRAFT_231757 [Thelephora terrestris]
MTSLAPGDPGTQTNLQPQQPALLQIDPKCLHSALKEFFDPLRTGDSRADFFALYRRESEEFDKDYAGKYDEDLNTSLIFAGLFSAVSSAFIIDVQSNLQPNPNAMTAAYLQILIHNMNNTLFPDADPSSTTWTGPPPEIVNVQSLLYSSLATSLFAAFIAMLGKQWVNRYIRKQGGSAAEKSRDRQRKLDGSKDWYFQLVIESLPVMLQFALLLLGCALTLYLWTISQTVAGVILAFTLFGIASYAFFTLTATLHYDCPYQTPPSVLIRAIIRRLAQSDPVFVRSLRRLTSFLPSIKDLRRLLGRLLSGLRLGLKCFHCVSTVDGVAEGMAQVVPVVLHARIFEDIPVDLEVCKGDCRCIWWVLDYTTDSDVIFSTARFAADMVWYPEIASVVSPRVLADLFFDCFFGGGVISGKSEQANAIGMALASVLSTRLVIDPEDQELGEILQRIQEGSCYSSEPTCSLVENVLPIAAKPVPDVDQFSFCHYYSDGIMCHLSTLQRLWLSRVVLQCFWRKRFFSDPTTVLSTPPSELFRKGGTTDDEDTPTILKTTYLLVAAISLGLQIDSRDLYPPDTPEALRETADVLCRQLRKTIGQGVVSQDQNIIEVLNTLVQLDLFTVTKDPDMGFTLIEEILGSRFSEKSRYKMAGIVVRLLGSWYWRGENTNILAMIPEWTPPLLNFLSLSEKFYPKRPPPFPESIALCLLPDMYESTDFGTTILPILSSTLFPTNHLQSRTLALKVFRKFSPGFFSSQMEEITADNLETLLRAVGDPFLFNRDTPLPDGLALPTGSDYKPISTALVLIEFALSSPVAKPPSPIKLHHVRGGPIHGRGQEGCYSTNALKNAFIYAEITLYGCAGCRSCWTPRRAPVLEHS